MLSNTPGWPKAKNLLVLLASFRRLFVGLGVFSCIGIAISGAVITSNLRLLVYSHQTADGTFDSYTETQDIIRYHFSVKGFVYRGVDVTASHRLSDIEAGEPFTVYYYPRNPNVNRIPAPDRIWHENTVELSIFVFLLVTCLFFAILPRVLLKRMDGAHASR